MTHNKLLVIIVSYNAMQWAERCLTSLRQSTVPCDTLVVDNGSTDGTPDYIHSIFPEIELIENKENLGFGKANNIGLKRVLDEGYDYAYLLNQDAWVQPDTFEMLIRVSQAHPEYGVLSPMQLQADGIHFEKKFCTNVLVYRQTYSPRLVEDLFFGRTRDVYETSFVMAAHWLITSRCIAKVGGFSPTFPHYGEDDNYLTRTNYWKFKIGIVPSARAVHDRGDSVWSDEKEIYVNDYVGLLVDYSNPLKKKSLGKCFYTLLKKGIGSRQKAYFKYIYRFCKATGKAKTNYERSLREGAFLQTT